MIYKSAIVKIEIKKMNFQYLGTISNYTINYFNYITFALFKRTINYLNCSKMTMNKLEHLHICINL